MATVASAPPVAALPIEVSNFVKRFGALTAVDGVSLRLDPGQCLGLLGPNGAGKSTLIRAIVGRVIPDSGQIRIFGTAPAPAPPASPSAGFPRKSPSIRASPAAKTSPPSASYHGLSAARSPNR